ncbi:hypothetical protein SR41_10125 [Sphingomonas melonis]|uniref:Uncharacterized protein n=1 Tax=Sphingomonas melonis TaxID=152682 RepID=A0A0D1K2C2_9SPHN|nr:hypothetical protein [Sphingomonas melonis]KIU27673.1 hypothetical protein SR41_10125 [Sphingomonas melonis]
MADTIQRDVRAVMAQTGWSRSLGAGTCLHFATQRNRTQGQASGIARGRWLAPWFGFAVMALIAIVD